MSQTPPRVGSTPILPDRTPVSGGRWAPALLWNGLFGTVAILVLRGRLDTPAPAVDWLLLALAALGPLLLVRAAVETARAARFRGLRLEPDPPVPSPGGEVGGTVVVPVPTGRDAADFHMTLHCLRRERGDDGVRDRVLWSREFTPRVSPGHGATRLSFAVPLDPSLPPAEEGREGIRWILRVTGRIPGLDLDASFRLPVQAAAEPAGSGIPLLTGDASPGRDFQARGIALRRDGGALLLDFGARRTLGMGLAFGTFGGVFLAGAAFVAVATGLTAPSWDGAFEVAFGLVTGFFVLACGLAGLGLLLLGVWLATNRLQVEVRPDRIRARRRVLWFVPAGRAEVEVASVDRLEARITSQVGQGARTEVGYRIVAHTGRGRVTVGDGIRGAGLLHRLARPLERETGLELEIPAEPIRLRPPGSPGGS